MRFIGRRDDACPDAPARARWRWAEAETGRQPTHHALRGLQLRRPRGDPRRRARATTAATRRTFAQLLYAPEMHDPDLLIRTSGEQRHLELPAVAVRLLRARVPRRAVARLLRAASLEACLEEFARRASAASGARAA